MKKKFVLISMLFVLCGCGNTSKEDIVKNFEDNMKSSKSYKMSGTMEIMNDEESFTYNLESYYMKDEYYKVVLVNQTNNHEQIILKNENDVYVITPELNKSFKFQSEWPNNSSQAYLINSVLKDIKNDKEIKLIDDENSYVIKTKVNYPNNNELAYQKIYFDKKNNIEKVEVYNNNDIIKIKVLYDKVDYTANLNKNDFDISNYIDKEKDCDKTECEGNKNVEDEKNKTEKNEKPPITDESTENNESSPTENEVQTKEEIQKQENQNNQVDTNQETNSQTSSFNLDSIIYPLYIPGETYLTNSETLKTENGNRVILTFTGEKNFVIIEEMAQSEPTMKIIPVYGDPLMMSGAIGALTGNSLSWDSNNISYYLASTDLSTNEMLTIANSLGNISMASKEK